MHILGPKPRVKSNNRVGLYVQCACRTCAVNLFGHFRHNLTLKCGNFLSLYQKSFHIKKKTISVQN